MPKIANVLVATEDSQFMGEIEDVLTKSGHNVVVKTTPGLGEAISILERLIVGMVDVAVIEGTPYDPSGPYMAGYLRAHFRDRDRQITIISLPRFPLLPCRWGDINLKSAEIERLERLKGIVVAL